MKKIATRLTAFVSALALLFAPAMAQQAQTNTQTQINNGSWVNGQSFPGSYLQTLFNSVNTGQTVAAGSLPQLTTSQIGTVASGNVLANSVLATTAAMFRWPMWMRATVSGKLAFVIPNFYVNGSFNEVGPGAAITVTGSLEYPPGTFQQMTFNNGASTSMTVANGAIGVSDFFANPPPVGAQFFARLYVTTAGTSLPMKTVSGTPAGAGFVNLGTDQTMSGTVTNAYPYPGWSVNVNTLAFSPIVIGSTKSRAFALIGASRIAGGGDSFNEQGPLVGLADRTVGSYAPTINLGIVGDSQYAFNLSHTLRVALAGYATDIINEYGLNDLPNTPATVIARYQAFQTYFPTGTKISLVTQGPLTTVANATITTLAYAGTVETLTLPQGAANYAPTANLFLGEQITISGATPSTANGVCTIQTITAGNVATCNNPLSTGTGTATGTPVYATGWQDVTNQTPFLGVNDSQRASLNEYCRFSAVAAGFYRCLDIAAILESGYNSGYWGQFNDAGVQQAMTVDGNHPNLAGYLRIKKSGIFSPQNLY